MSSEKQNKFDWSQLVSISAILAVVLVFPVYLGNKIDGLRTEMHQMMQQSRSEMNQFRTEMQFFHGKQCTFDAELNHVKNQLAKR